MLPKAVQTAVLVDDGQVYPHRCLVWFAHLVGAVGATTTGLFYDGFSSSANLRLVMSGVGMGVDDLAPARPVPFMSGCYVAMGAGATYLTVGFVPLPED